MFDDMLIVNTAISSFNNAALYAPFFLVVGLMTLPLLFMSYVYGYDFVSKFGWNRNNFNNQISLWTSLSLLLWLMLFGGNYAVIRDGISVLPTVLALVLFLLVSMVIKKSIQLNYLEKIRKKRYILLGLCILGFMAFFASGTSLIEFLLQICAIFCGFIVGCCSKKEHDIIFGNVTVLAIVTILVLMQPEFFRFGQMGNLTPIHILSIVFVGFCAVTTLATRYTKACGKMRQSVYVKMKWLLRIVSFLAFVMFISTESVPVFLGFILSVGLSEALSVYHRKTLSDGFYKFSFAMLLISFGIIIICPMISALGCLYLASESQNIKFPDLLTLL